MRLRNRFTLVGLGIVIFLIITPALILYARGFQIDWENRTFVKTGALVVKTQPTKAEVFLNDEKHDSTTPANVRFILPGDYNIRLEKEGYQSWTKRLSVKSQLVTWANFNRDYLALFLKNPEHVQNLQIQASTISRDGDEIIYVMPDQVGLINTNNGDLRTLVRVNDLNLPLLTTNAEIKWHDSSQILGLFTNRSLLNTLENQAASIQHLEIDDGRIVAMIGSDLYSLQSGNLALIEKAIINFTLRNDELWYVQKNSLKKYNFNNNQSEMVFSQLPASKQTQIIRTSNQIYLILDSTLYLFNGSLEKIYGPVTYAFWYDNPNQLLYANDHEIYTYDPSAKESTLIVRSLTPIANPVLNPETGYIFYQNEGKIKAIELDGRDHRNIFTIANAQDRFTISNDGKLLFTIGKAEIKEYTIR